LGVFAFAVFAAFAAGALPPPPPPASSRARFAACAISRWRHPSRIVFTRSSSESFSRMRVWSSLEMRSSCLSFVASSSRS
jgi:hypothetical protein